MIKMLLILVLIVDLFIEIHGGCPVRCNCTENSVACIAKNLEYVPYFESLENNPVIIDLSGNSISIIDIDDFSFDKSDQVKEIYFNGSELVTIEEMALEELENLQELYLADNHLNSLPEGFISSNENMILLDISRNFFIDMPKIKSESLEVLAIANSGVSTISDDALEGLPHLRVLLLQQNNLKRVNPVIFDNMGNLFFVSIAFNPWQCNCNTVKLLEHLTIKRFADITEPIQCQTDAKIFVDIYNEKGVAPAFKEECNSVNPDPETNETWEMEEFLRNGNSGLSDPVLASNSSRNELDIDYLYFTNFYYSLILCSAIVLSLVAGAAFGSCLTFKYLNGNIRQTDSFKELLSKSNDFA